MSIVTLVSGGLDSAVMSALAKEEGLEQHPLFIDYGQRARNQEWMACQRILRSLRLTKPVKMDLKGFGQVIPSGLTNRKLRLNEDAFLPGRNLLFVLMAASFAYVRNSSAVAIGLLSEKYHLFPDQTKEFLKQSEQLIALAFGREIKVIAPLMRFNKKDVVDLANRKKITGTYSCHSGEREPCGKCVSCLEFVNSGIKLGGKNGR
jgi:7-cyano-7-deazaguanine synthase